MAPFGGDYFALDLIRSFDCLFYDLITGLLPVYFGSLAFCYILVFTCMLLLQWRKQILQKRRAKVWMKQLKAESYFQHALAHRADEEAQPRTNTATCNPDNILDLEPQSTVLPSENIVESNINSTPPLLDSAPYKPVFQEVPCACALSHLPPLLAHSASYPCSTIPAESSPFSSPLKPTILKYDPYSMGRRISA
ncbi:testis-expressed protein 38 [Pseudonaja textilis]|uniref:testis-expressed protein 38 n=1 Tax=Pseudonaja textilis TaxID=8673 RepID=UPI000EA96276|nr:testis-expressed protein 38 [Pseudonaja textilis]